MAQPALAESTEFYRFDANRKLDSKTRSALGQFMTHVPITRFMASLFNDFDGGNIHLLDAGAGVGSLTAAFVENFTHRSHVPCKINTTAYEIVLTKHVDMGPSSLYIRSVP